MYNYSVCLSWNKEALNIHCAPTPTPLFLVDSKVFLGTSNPPEITLFVPTSGKKSSPWQPLAEETWQKYPPRICGEEFPYQSYCWWFRNPANQLRLVVYPIIYRFFCIPGGFCRISEPPTVGHGHRLSKHSPEGATRLIHLRWRLNLPKKIWMFPKIVGFPPKSSILIGFSIRNRPFSGYSTPIFWKHPNLQLIGSVMASGGGCVSAVWILLVKVHRDFVPRNLRNRYPK